MSSGEHGHGGGGHGAEAMKDSHHVAPHPGPVSHNESSHHSGPGAKSKGSDRGIVVAVAAAAAIGIGVLLADENLEAKGSSKAKYNASASNYSTSRTY